MSLSEFDMLITRERAQHSDREVLARLTPDGQALFERHFPKAAAFMAALMDERVVASIGHPY